MNKYQKLLDYYKKCFSFVDYFHFNSETSQDVFMQYLPTSKGKVVSITHGGIEDHRKKKAYAHDNLHIGFIGNSTPYKGLPLLISMLKDIGMSESWDLSVWGGGVGKHPSLPIYYKGKFDNRSVATVYGEMDVLIVPSIWKETFGFVVLEALSYGVPVIVSENVGAKDIVKRYDERFVFTSESELSALLKDIMNDRSLLEDFNEKILNDKWKYSMKDHTEAILKLYSSIK